MERGMLSNQLRLDATYDTHIITPTREWTPDKYPTVALPRASSRHSLATQKKPSNYFVIHQEWL